MIGLFMIVLIILIFIFSISAIKNKEAGGDIVFRHLYTYLVLFATLMMVIGGGVSIFMATADLVSPTGYYQSYTEYKQMTINGKIDGNKDNQLSEEEIRSNYDHYLVEEKARQKDRAINQIIKSLGFIVIPLPVFFYFNKRRKQSEE